MWSSARLCWLELDELVPWDKMSVRVAERDIPKLPEILAQVQADQERMRQGLAIVLTFRLHLKHLLRDRDELGWGFRVWRRIGAEKRASG